MSRKLPKSLDPAHDGEKIVAAKREHRIDQIVPRALVAKIDLQPVGEEGEEAFGIAHGSSRIRRRG